MKDKERQKRLGRIGALVGLASGVAFVFIIRATAMPNPGPITFADVLVGFIGFALGSGMVRLILIGEQLEERRRKRRERRPRL